MKTIYKKPMINIQRFAANEYVAACTDYTFCCNAKVPNGEEQGLLFQDNNNNRILDDGDRLINKHSNKGFALYTPCQEGENVHIVSGPFNNGFLVSLNTFHNAKKWFWDMQSPETQRTFFHYNKLNPSEHVYLWYSDVGGWHASSSQPTKNHS